MTSLDPARRTTERAIPARGFRRTRPKAPGKTSSTAAKPSARGVARLAQRAKVAGTVTATVARTTTATAVRTAGATAKFAGTTAAAARSVARRKPAARTDAAVPAAPLERGPAEPAPVPAVPEVAAGAPAVARPTPFPRTPTPADTAPAAVPVAAAPVAPEAAPSEGGEERRRLRRHVSPRRPALCLAAALVGAVSISAAAAGDPAAKADTSASESVSVAEALGVEGEGTRAIVSDETTDRLGELVASRAERDAEQAEATRVQAAADREAVEAARRAAAAAAEAAKPDVVLPVEGARLTSGYGSRWGTLHAGIDLAAPMHTPEYAAMDGVVLEAGPASGFGLAVYIQHENGDVTVYGHMDEILVTAGQVVQAGDTIALLGNTGQSTGPHLHFEVHQGGIDGTKVDPLPWLRAGGVEI